MESNENILHRKGKSCPSVPPRPPSRVRASGRETVEFSVRGPLPVNIDEEPVTIPGCSILDLVFTTPALVGEVTFRNYYTASISVLVRSAEPSATICNRSQSANDSATSVGEWKLAIARKELMPQPHLEHGSHSLVSVVVTESTIEWNSLVAMRLVLRQPSPVWRVFHVEELNVYADLPRLSLKSDVANFTFNHQQQQQQHQQQQHYDKMLALVRRQTLAALSWLPPEPPSSNSAPPPPPPPSSLHKPSGPCGYELTKLPQI